jgi:hypothetical protein
MFRELLNRTPDNNEVSEGLLSALLGGPDHALQQGTLAAYIVQAKTTYTHSFMVSMVCVLYSLDH